MPRPAALQGDGIQCSNCPHCPYIIIGPYVPIGIITACKAVNFIVLGRPIATIGDLGICGGPTVLTTGAFRFIVMGTPVHRITDFNSCLGVTVGPGAPNFLISD
jgi:uncharacterized Zn-binding protein involved in type VI secretion